MLFNVSGVHLEIIISELKQFKKYIQERHFIIKIDGIVITNSYFTQSAEESAYKLDIILWDRDELQRLLNESTC